MNTLMNLKNRDIIDLLSANIALFDIFDRVYLFGSILDGNKVPNDIDILLIYSTYSTRILEATIRISNSLESICGVSCDLIVLSIEEERETHFLDRISSRCLRLK